MVEPALAPAPRPQRRVEPRLVVAAVADWYAVTMARLRGPRRHARIVGPRSVAMYLLHKRVGMSLPEVGRELGRHHTTVLSAVRRVETMPELRAEAAEIARRLGL